MLVTNWSLEARFYELAPPNPESPQEQNIRLQSAQAYRDAVSVLQDKWRDSYDEAFRLAVTAGNRQSGMSKRREERKRDFYRNRKNEIPQPAINTAVLTNRSQVRSFKHAAFANWTKPARLAEWRRHITKDVLASVLEDSRNVVDIR